jgi:prepilin-type N-terminal cleavage/methylation domain-containing protein
MTQIKGFSLVELMISSAVSLILLGGIMGLVNHALKGNSNITQRSQLQQNAQVAMNLIAQDLTIAGTGISQGGIPLPNGTVSTSSKRGCTSSGCGSWNLTSDYGTDNVNNRLYSVLCGSGLGPNVGAGATDIISVIYLDTSVDLGTNLAAMANDGSTITLLTGKAAALKANDVLMLCNSMGCAAGAVTANPAGDVVPFGNGDALSFNQSNATQGKISGLNPAQPTSITADKILIVTYYIEASTMRLMRQVNLNPPVPVAEIIENLQFTYDIQGGSGVTSNLDDAGTSQNQIRKINIRVVARSLNPEVSGKYDRIELTSSVSIRNLAFIDRFPT